MSAVIEIARADLKINDDWNVRAKELRAEAVEEYGLNYDNIEASNPPEVFNIGSVCWLVHGWHRIAAADKIKREKIRVKVVGTGSELEAQNYALKSNFENGIRLTPRQKHEIAIRLRDLNKWSLRETADFLHVHFTTVRNWLENPLLNNSTVDAENSRASQDNRARGGSAQSVWMAFSRSLPKELRGVPSNRWPELVKGWEPSFRDDWKQHIKPIAELYQIL